MAVTRMNKEAFAAYLRVLGHDAYLESGVVMVRVCGKLTKKVMNDYRKIADEAGYIESFGFSVNTKEQRGLIYESD